MIKTTIHPYYFDVSKPDEYSAYAVLATELRSAGFRCFDVAETSFGKAKRSEYTEVTTGESKVVELDCECLFNDQWNTTPESGSLRLFDWYERIYPNRNVKSGYYLSQTDEMITLRQNRFKCGYCGHQVDNPKDTFCLKCLDSNYLELDNLHLLRYASIAASRNGVSELTDQEKAYIVPLYEKAQKEAKAKRCKKHSIKLAEEYKRDLDRMAKEYEGKQWLLERNIETNNVIYYAHLDKFTFGWSKPYESTSQVEELKKLLAEFPFNYSIKTQ